MTLSDLYSQPNTFTKENLNLIIEQKVPVLNDFWFGTYSNEYTLTKEYQNIILLSHYYNDLSCRFGRKMNIKNNTHKGILNNPKLLNAIYFFDSKQITRFLIWFPNLTVEDSDRLFEELIQNTRIEVHQLFEPQIRLYKSMSSTYSLSKLVPNGFRLLPEIEDSPRGSSDKMWLMYESKNKCFRFDFNQAIKKHVGKHVNRAFVFDFEISDLVLKFKGKEKHRANMKCSGEYCLKTHTFRSFEVSCGSV